jgi:hypothetical protein
MVNKKQVGKIQIIFGIILLIAAVIASIWAMQQATEGFVTFTKSLTIPFNKFINTTDVGIKNLATATLTSTFTLQTQNYLIAMAIIAIGALILIVLAISLILQGLSNTSTK